jgi:hypothetical protein
MRMSSAFVEHAYSPAKLICELHGDTNQAARRFMQEAPHGSGQQIDVPVTGLGVLFFDPRVCSILWGVCVFVVLYCSYTLQSIFYASFALKKERSTFVFFSAGIGALFSVVLLSGK